jgi:predicted lipoprotein
MKINKISRILSFVALAIYVQSCKKDEVEPIAVIVNTQDIINDISSNINASTYLQLKTNTTDLYAASLVFASNSTEQNLNICRDFWKAARSSWEQSEGFIYGPVATENIDPRIDTWPVNFVDLNAQIDGTNQFTDTYVNNLEDALKGFHPIEFLLWGQNGTKTYNQFTSREKEYLVALTKNLETLTAELYNQWNTNLTDSYIHHFKSPSALNPYYGNKKAVFQEIVNAMIGICDEVAAGKIGEPFINADPSLEESPYAQNSMTDFRNNIKSVQNVYLGKFNADGVGLEDLVRKYNLSLDNMIKAKINTSITALNNITDPFGIAIISQPTQVQNAITAIEDLKNALEIQLLPFVNQYVTD